MTDHHHHQQQQQQQISNDAMLDIAMKSKCPVFLKKCYHMITCCDSAMADWAQDGSSFFIKNVSSFSSQILPRYFKHSNFSSFVRQLNFYGFAKTRDVKWIMDDGRSSSTSTSSGRHCHDHYDSKHWQFQHEHFQRNEPELLIRIVRRMSGGGTTTSAGTVGPKGNSSVGGGSGTKGMTNKEKEKDEIVHTTKETNQKIMSSVACCDLTEIERKERDSIQQEIQFLKGQLVSMEDQVKKLTDIVKTVTLASECNGASGGDGDDDVHVGGEHELKMVNACKDIIHSKEIDVSLNSKHKRQKVVLVKDSCFMDDANSIDAKICSHGNNLDDDGDNDDKRVLSNAGMLTTTGRSVVSIIQDHVASMDLPDLGLVKEGEEEEVSGERLIKVNDDNESGGLAMDVDCNATIHKGSSARAMELAATITNNHCVHENLVEIDDNKFDDDDDDDDFIHSLQPVDSDMIWPLSQHSQEPSFDMERMVVDDEEEVLPALVILDEKKNKKKNDSVSGQQVDITGKRNNYLLDQKHILNLEKCLAMLPLVDRIKFVQDVMNNVQGLDDLFQQRQKQQRQGW
eukprot:CAMPEP_0176487482 /NCGR_PEP_ID=MMETSP0200_2-20121128/6159_1 /TAXON_ID=947934 /ORGANISM="Chaetoceros sp., Strain GSL56" /LENGTH=568 /DNA_ID=CAMNT_0017884321 /DNA_START=105 /DNA_END=1808 /DNA_ORIENTATION=+